VDAYKAMTNHKPYRKPLNKAKIIEELKAGAGRQFDPILARQFIAMISSA
jgi:HD-GYP domain-containing protein (c-di-GMP phosphodiesterase class II)